MFGSDATELMTLTISDPGTTGKNIMWFKASKPMEILSVRIASSNAQGAGSAGQFRLVKYTNSGSTLAGTYSGVMGGTAAASRLSANIVQEGSLVDGTIATGDIVMVAYTETGDWVEGLVTIQIETVNGIGAN